MIESSEGFKQENGMMRHKCQKELHVSSLEGQGNKTGDFSHALEYERQSRESVKWMNESGLYVVVTKSLFFFPSIVGHRIIERLGMA